MNEVYRKSLIKNIEENFKDFQSILYSLQQKDSEENRSSSDTLRDFFTTLMAVEEDVFEMRLKKIIDRENPYLPAIIPDKIKRQNYYDDGTLQEVIEKFLEQKKKLIKFLLNVPYGSWEKTGFHEVEGHVTFEEFIRRMIRNDKLNMSQIRDKYIKIDTDK
ncbi:MAG: hypothetical protein A2Y94_05110 [Caldithrix sp. RBG_13_44_9]|nr:MAG: hypothetical protein A2Y94_05110 [Caldithrix sp. RBG_13_44_9]